MSHHDRQTEYMAMLHHKHREAGLTLVISLRSSEEMRTTYIMYMLNSSLCYVKLVNLSPSLLHHGYHSLSPSFLSNYNSLPSLWFTSLSWSYLLLSSSMYPPVCRYPQKPQFWWRWQVHQCNPPQQTLGDLWGWTMAAPAPDRWETQRCNGGWVSSGCCQWECVQYNLK